MYIEEIVQIILKCDGFIFGDYVRDSYVLQQDSKKMDVCMSPDKKNIFKQMLLEIARVEDFIDLNPDKVNNCVDVHRHMHVGVYSLSLSSKNGDECDLKLNIIFLHWSSDAHMTLDCKYTCNLLMKDRLGVRLRYIPDCLEHEVDPYDIVINQIHEKELMLCSIIPQEHKDPRCKCQFEYKMSTLEGAHKEVENGWKMHVPSKCTHSFSLHNVNEYLEECGANELCAVCHEHLCNTNTDASQIIFTGGCTGKHSYHYECILNWFNKSQDSRCPQCRDESLIKLMPNIEW